MIRQVILIALCLTLAPLSSVAEITGSGFHDYGCSGTLSVMVWLDFNENGYFDEGDEPLSDIVMSAYRENSPELGVGHVLTSDRGVNSFDLLCDGFFILSLDASAAPIAVSDDHIYPELLTEESSDEWRINIGVNVDSRFQSNQVHLQFPLRPADVCTTGPRHTRSGTRKEDCGRPIIFSRPVAMGLMP